VKPRVKPDPQSGGEVCSRLVVVGQDGSWSPLLHSPSFLDPQAGKLCSTFLRVVVAVVLPVSPARRIPDFAVVE
jgi:hypothetical protein